MSSGSILPPSSKTQISFAALHSRKHSACNFSKWEPKIHSHIRKGNQVYFIPCAQPCCCVGSWGCERRLQSRARPGSAVRTSCRSQHRRCNLPTSSRRAPVLCVPCGSGRSHSLRCCPGCMPPSLRKRRRRWRWHMWRLPPDCLPEQSGHTLYQPVAVPEKSGHTLYQRVVVPEKSGHTISTCHCTRKKRAYSISTCRCTRKK